MDFIKNFLKKYSALLPPIGLLILAVIFLLPTLWLGGKVKAQMNDSVKQAQTIRSLMSDVPSKERPAQVKEYMDRLETEVKQIDAIVQQSSQRELVAYAIFPEPKDTSSQIYVNYGRNYLKAIEGLLTGMNALDAPSDAEIRSQTGAARTADAGAYGYGMGGVAARRPSKQDPMVDALCTARSEKISVYASPSVFAWYDFWQNFKYEGKDSALQDCWNGQVALWIYEDIAKSIQVTNLGSSRVSDSPVKRLLGVSFSGPVQVGGGQEALYRTNQPATAGRDNPNYVSGVLPSAFLAKPWTGRIGGAEYDVIHFAISVMIDSRDVLDFMRELCSEKEHSFREGFKADGPLLQSRHNQITILQDSVYVVAKEDPSHELYRYGNGAVVRLDLVCEYLLGRKGYDGLKPKPIKEMLGQLEGQTGTGGSGGAGSSFPGGGMPPGM